MTKYKLLRQSMTPIPEDAKGWLYVGQNNPIWVGVEGTEVVLKKDVGGYYLIHKADLNDLMKRVKQLR